LAVRKLKKSFKAVTGRFYSTLLSRLVQFDSLLERDFILLVDMHPSVRWFAEQPFKISMRGDPDTEKFYVPDFLVSFHPGTFLGRKTGLPWIVETKYSSDLRANWAKIHPKLRAGVREAHMRDSRFKIVTERRLHGIGLSNAHYLRRFLNADVSPEAIDRVVRAVQTAKRSTIGALTSETMPAMDEIDNEHRAIFVAIARRLINAEFDLPLGPETVVWSRLL
jgi:hypothetical protein